MYKIVRIYGGELTSLGGAHIYQEGVRHEGLFFIYPDFENALCSARAFAEVLLSPLVVYEVEAEVLPELPKRYPVPFAPEHLQCKWAELVKRGQIEEAEKLFAGELSVYTYPTIGITLAHSVVLKKPLLRLRNYFDELSKKYRKEVTVLDRSVNAEVVRDYCYDWEIKVAETQEAYAYAGGE